MSSDSPTTTNPSLRSTPSSTWEDPMGTTPVQPSRDPQVQSVETFDRSHDGPLSLPYVVSYLGTICGRLPYSDLMMVWHLEEFKFRYRCVTMCLLPLLRQRCWRRPTVQHRLAPHCTQSLRCLSVHGKIRWVQRPCSFQGALR